MRSQRGFTLVELLVTVLIIGILAAIGVAAYNGQRAKAKDSRAKTAVRHAFAAARTWWADTETFNGFVPSGCSGTPAVCTTDPLQTLESTLRSTTTKVNPGNAVSPTNDPTVIYVAQFGPSIRLCAASDATKVFCIRDDPTNGRTRFATGEGTNDGEATDNAINKVFPLTQGTLSDW